MASSASTITGKRTSGSETSRRLWHKSAPEALKKAKSPEANGDAWQLWTEHLASRRHPKPINQLCRTAESPLDWFVAPADGAAAGQRRSELQRLLAKRRLRADAILSLLAAWRRAEVDATAQPALALETLGWAHALPRLAAALESSAWWDLLDHLAVIVEEACSVRLDEQPWTHQLLCGELPLTLAYLFPELKATHRLAGEARDALSEGAIELLDGEGLPAAEHLALLRPLLACWVRCLLMGQHQKKAPFNGEAKNQVEWALRQALRMTRSDGLHAFSDDGSDTWPGELLMAALKLAGDDDDREIASLLLPSRKGKGKKKAKSTSRLHLPEASVESEWSAIAAMRCDWTQRSPRLTVTYPERCFAMECETGGEVIFSGDWDFAIEQNGQRLEIESDWNQVCWTSDEDGDYLELEVELGRGVRLQRHLMLAREDQFILLADSILGSEDAELQYRATIPLRPGIAWEDSAEHTEGFLVGRKRRAQVLPLGLAEWRCDPRPLGALEKTEQGLELQMAARGRALFAPLWLDLSPRRMGRPLTWRHLTVAESLQIQPRDVAVGYRVQVSKEQWLVYRSLGPRANRTVLGHNLSTEMLVARFDEEGDVDPLLEIE